MRPIDPKLLCVANKKHGAGAVNVKRQSDRAKQGQQP